MDLNSEEEEREEIVDDPSPVGVDSTGFNSKKVLATGNKRKGDQHKKVKESKENPPKKKSVDITTFFKKRQTDANKNNENQQELLVIDSENMNDNKDQEEKTNDSENINNKDQEEKTTDSENMNDNKDKEEKTNDSQTKNKTYRKQSFCDSWLDKTEFRGWLSKVKGDKYKARCTACGKTLSTSKTLLLRHAASDVHLKSMASLKYVPTLTEKEAFQKSHNQKTKVKKAEIRLALYVAEHNLSFGAAKHIGPLVAASFSGMLFD